MNEGPGLTRDEVVSLLGERIQNEAEVEAFLAEERRTAAEKAWDEGFEEPRECCGLCPRNSCPWDGGRRGPANPYRAKETKA